MNIAIISSSKDLAGISIRNNLIELFDFEDIGEKLDDSPIFRYNNVELYQINQELIFAENIDKKIDADVFIFASRHRSRENTPSFTVHPIGNWDKAEFGGEGKKLCFSSAVLLKNLFIGLNKNGNKNNYEISMEATHHGPYMEKPAVFVEIGSTEKEWSDKNNGEVIAKTIIGALSNQNNIHENQRFSGHQKSKGFFSEYRIAVGIGGTHYCAAFNKIILSTNIALSHICPKHHLDKLGKELLQQAIEKTKEKVDFILLDWKGLGTEKQRILNLLKNINLEFKRGDRV